VNDLCDFMWVARQYAILTYLNLAKKYLPTSLLILSFACLAALIH